MIKYYAFIALQESIQDKNDALKALRPEQFAFIKRINATDSEDKESIFLLEAYYDSISIYSEAGEGSEKIRACIEKMETICEQQDVVSHYVTQAKTILAIDIFNDNMKNTPEEGFEYQLKRKR